ncbi:MAG TPA: DUF370 domain-containing protein [Dehalococcoidia bacterium]|nr:DUF370 domain-containing protein [Dehalococcoidia bacterium]
MSTELVHVGFGNIVAIDKVIAIVSPASAPVKRMLQAAKGKGLLVDLTSGRRTKAALVMESGHIILVAIAAETIAGRVAASRGVEFKSE